MPNADLDLFACPACKHETLTLDHSSNLICAGCGAVFPQNDGIVDFRYLEEKFKNIDARVEEDFDDPDAPSDVLIQKQGSTRIMVSRLEKRIRSLHRERGPLRVLDVGMFMANADGIRPFLRGIEPCIETYVGIDPSPDKPTTQQKKDGKIQILRSYGEYLPIRANKFDLVVSVATFDHLFDVDKCLSEIKRVMSSDGLLYITLNNDGSWFKRMFKKTAGQRRELARRWHNYFWTAPQFRNLLSDHGFQIVDARGYRYNPFFDNAGVGKALNGNVKLGACMISDVIGNAIAQDFGGNFAIVCRPS